MTRLTGTHSEVSEIESTTLTMVPGTLKVHDDVGKTAREL